MTKKKLVEAYSFFEEESNEFRKEMAVEDLLVDIACEFINFRVKNNMSQKDYILRFLIWRPWPVSSVIFQLNPSETYYF